MAANRSVTVTARRRDDHPSIAGELPQMSFPCQAETQVKGSALPIARCPAGRAVV